MAATVWHYFWMLILEIIVIGGLFTGYYYLFEAGLIDWPTLLGQSTRPRLEKVEREEESLIRFDLTG